VVFPPQGFFYSLFIFAWFFYWLCVFGVWRANDFCPSVFWDTETNEPTVPFCKRVIEGTFSFSPPELFLATPPLRLLLYLSFVVIVSSAFLAGSFSILKIRPLHARLKALLAFQGFVSYFLPTNCRFFSFD